MSQPPCRSIPCMALYFPFVCNLPIFMPKWGRQMEGWRERCSGGCLLFISRRWLLLTPLFLSFSFFPYLFLLFFVFQVQLLFVFVVLYSCVRVSLPPLTTAAASTRRRTWMPRRRCRSLPFFLQDVRWATHEICLARVQAEHADTDKS